jgi:hypothetical protein
LFFRRQARPAFFFLTVSDTNRVCLAVARIFLSEILALHFSRIAPFCLPMTTSIHKLSPYCWPRRSKRNNYSELLCKGNSVPMSFSKIRHIDIA